MEAYQLPDGWKWTSIGTHYAFKNGLNKAKRFFGQGTPIINYMDVYGNQRLSAADVQGKVTVTNDEVEAYSALQGDAFFTRTSETVSEIGYSAVLLEPINRAVFSGFVLRGRPKTKELLPEYAGYALRARDVRKQIESRATYTTRALTNGRSLSECLFPLPREPEQKAIAQALSDIDDLISSLDALIEKKRDIKQGAIQQLLTGKRRLPGFSGEWPLSKIGGIFDILRNGSHARAAFQDDGEVYCAHYGAIHGTSRSHVTPGTFPRLKESFASGLPFAQDGDLLLADASEDLDGIGKSVELMNCGAHKIVAGLHTILLRPKPKAVAPGYAGYLQFKPEFKSGLIRIANGISVYGISKNSLREIEVKLPSYDEQAQIAQFLITLQSEIAHQAYKRAKLYALRHGMMQQLLTGRVRLK